MAYLSAVSNLTKKFISAIIILSEGKSKDETEETWILMRNPLIELGRNVQFFYFIEGGVLYEKDSRIRSDDGSRCWRC